LLGLGVVVLMMVAAVPVYCVRGERGEESRVSIGVSGGWPLEGELEPPNTRWRQEGVMRKPAVLWQPVLLLLGVRGVFLCCWLKAGSTSHVFTKRWAWACTGGRGNCFCSIVS